MKFQTKPLLLAVALFSLSSSALWVRLANSHLSVIGFWRLLIAGTIMGLFPSLRNQWSEWKTAQRTDILLSLICGVWFFLHIWTYMKSAQTTSVAHLTLIFSSSPIFTALGAWIWFRESFKKKWLIIYALAACGIGLLFYDHQGSSVSLEGDLYALLTAVLHSAYALTSKKARIKVPNSVFSSLLYLSSGLLFLIWALAASEILLPMNSNFWVAIAGLVILPSLLGHTLFTYLLNHLNINFLSCAKLSEPALSSIMAFIFFDQALGAQALLAYALVSVAVLALYLDF